MEPMECKRRQLALKKQQLTEKQRCKATGPLAGALAAKIPQGLADTLERAFCGAFRLVFQQGLGLVEKTYPKQKLQREFARQQAAVQAAPCTASLRRLEKSATKGGALASLGTAAEGGVLGLFGIGLPDIPLFAGVLLRGVCQIAVSYGFAYDTNEERAYLLSVITAALAEGPDAARWAAETARLAARMDGPGSGFCVAAPALEGYIAAAGGALSKTMLTAKFVQGLPIVGAAAAAANLTAYRQVTARARLEYQLRWLEKQALGESGA